MKPYRLSDVKGLNRIDSRWNMSLSWMHDLKNGYLEKSPSGRTIIKQRWGLRRLTSTPMVFSQSFAQQSYPWPFSLFKADSVTGRDKLLAQGYDENFNAILLAFDLNALNGDWEQISSPGAISAPRDAKPWLMYNTLPVHVPSNQQLDVTSNTLVPFCADTSNYSYGSPVTGLMHNQRLLLSSVGGGVFQFSANGDFTSATAFSTAMNSARITSAKFCTQGIAPWNFFSINKNVLAVCMMGAVVLFNVADVIEQSSIMDVKFLDAVSPNGFLQLCLILCFLLFVF